MTLLDADHEPDETWLEQALVTFARTGDQQLRDEIVERSLWLAQRSARRFADRGEPFDDVVQVASVALLHAIDRFDPSIGVPFGAYATPTIVGEIKRHFRDRTWRVHVPRQAKDVRPAVNTAHDGLTTTLGRSPTANEVAAHLGIEEDLVLQALEANTAYRTAPLDLASERRPRSDRSEAHRRGARQPRRHGRLGQVHPHPDRRAPCEPARRPDDLPAQRRDRGHAGR